MKKPPMCSKPNWAGEQKNVLNGKFELKVWGLEVQLCLTRLKYDPIPSSNTHY